MTNTLKHAQAKHLSLHVSSNATHLQVCIFDDGKGFELDAALRSTQGKGLNSLQKRARMLDASVSISSSPTGTRIELQVPLAV